MTRGAWAVARLLQGVPATTINLDELEEDWRELAAAIVDAPDRGAALESALADRPDGKQRWVELLACDALSSSDELRTTRLLTFEELEQLPEPRWLVHDHLVAESISVLFGPSGGGKTFVALDLALTVATGQKWLGAEAVETGYVVYATGEGLSGLARRISAWRAAHGNPSLGRFRVLPVAVQFMQRDDLEQLRADLRTLPEAPKLIIVDTLARSMIGAEENSAKDMGLFLDGVEQMTREWHAHVLLVHHTGKNGEMERGTSALRGYVQTMLRLVGEDGTATLSCDKQKDGAAPFEPHPLRLVPTDDGTTCTIEVAARAGATAGELTSKARAVLAALDANFLSEGATATEWMKVCAVPDSTFYSSRKQLLLGEYVVRIGKRYVLLEKGRSALGQTAPGFTPTPKELQKDSNGSGSHPNSTTPTLPLRELEYWSSGTGTGETPDPDDSGEGAASLLGRERLALTTLDETFGSHGATDAEWRDACIERGQARTSYYRAKPVLLARSLVTFEGEGVGARFWLVHERAGSMVSQQSHLPGPETSTTSGTTPSGTGTGGTAGTGTSGTSTGGTDGTPGSGKTAADNGSSEAEGGLPWR